MKIKHKALLLSLCAVLLVAASVLGTIAYLTDQEAVTNTFSVGKVGLSLDEAKVNEFGEKDGNTRVTANTYKLIPGHTYLKDPTVHVDADSENAWIFVEVKNGISAIETTETDKTIEKQILANGWTALDGVSGVYYMSYTKGQVDKDLEVFQNFTVAGTADYTVLSTYTSAKVTVTAYAIQSDGFSTAAAAWPNCQAS